MLLVQAAGGAYLVDTGMSDYWIERTDSLDGTDIYPRMKSDDAVERQLAALGLGTHDLTRVINTHLHFDHAGGNAHFPYVPILLQAAELEAARAGTISSRDWDVPGLRYETIQVTTRCAQASTCSSHQDIRLGTSRCSSHSTTVIACSSP
jgi:N-acyl homoserine lactone hydrolase